MLVIALITTQANAQIKVITGGNVGIGQNNPTQKLEIFGNQLISGNGNKLFFGNDQRYLGFPASTQDFSLISKNENQMRIGANYGIAFFTNSTLAESSNGNNHSMYLNNYGLGIGTNWQAWSTGTPLSVGGNCYLSGYLTQGSDIRFKKEIKPIESALDKVLNLNGRIYVFKQEEFKDYSFPSGTNFGFIAQELKEILPDLVSEDNNGYLAVNYIAVIPVLVEAIKEQNNQIEELKEKLQYGNVTNAVKNSDNILTPSLSQNNPNPFTEKTEIKYFVPENANKATIFIYNMNGLQIKEVELNNKGKSSITINGSELEAGMYLYALIVDGKELDTKRMILTK